MFKKLDIPNLGFIENMNVHICNNCGAKDEVFGHGAINKLTNEHELHLLGQLPLNIDVRISADNGIPIENEGINNEYLKIATNMLNNLAKLPKDYSSKLGSIKVIS